MLTYNAGCNETLRARSCQREVPLMLWVSLVDWDECEMQQTKGVCDGVAAHKAGRESLFMQKVGRFFLQTGGRCVLATPKKAKADCHAESV